MSKKKESVLRYSAVAATLSALEAGTNALSDIEYIGTHDPNAAYKKHNKVIKDYAYYFAVQDVPINSNIPVTDVNYWKLILDFNTPFTDVQDALIVSETNADESALDAEKQAQNTTSFTDSNGTTFSKGAKGYADDASQSATASQNSATASSQSASQASTHKNNAETAETNAVTAKNAAELAETNAETAESGAVTAKNAAETARTGAETAETNALTAKNAAETAQAAAETTTDYLENELFHYVSDDNLSVKVGLGTQVLVSESTTGYDSVKLQFNLG